jgi:hypothetical protein
MMRGTATTADDLEMRAREMRDGTYTESDAAVLVTRDASSGILTFSYPGCSPEDAAEVFDEAATLRGYTKKKEWKE